MPRREGPIERHPRRADVGAVVVGPEARQQACEPIACRATTEPTETSRTPVTDVTTVLSLAAENRCLRGREGGIQAPRRR